METQQADKLRSERDRFVALSFCWADLLFELDGQHRIVFAAGPTGPLLGRTPEQLKGTPFLDITAGPDRPLGVQALKLADRQGRINRIALRLQGAHGMTPSLAVAGYRLDQVSNHFFIAMRAGAGPNEIGPSSSGGGGGSTLLDAKNFAGAAARQVQKIRESGGDAKVTLVSLNGYSELKGRLDAASQASLAGTVEACLRANSAGGDGAAQVDGDKFTLVHEAGIDIAEVEREIADAARDVDPEHKGVEVETATIDTDAEISEEDMAKSLIYVVNRFRETQGGFTLESLSTNLTTLFSEAAGEVDSFRKTVADRSFDLAFQPIIQVHSGEVHHFEALTRFRGGRSAGGSPYEQITFAEETGLISEFDIAIVHKAVEWLSRWPRNTTRYRIAVNISGFSVGVPAYIEELHRVLRENSWIQDKLLFEITESSRMADLDSANMFIQGLRKNGYHVCLDDFGAGAASFQYLSALDVDVVKLDGSAIRNALKGVKGRAFLTALTNLCRSLGVETIAEMIDSETGLKFVRTCGVDYVQGFLFGEPSKDIKAFSPLPRLDLFKGGR